jgi:hypothetical protein
VARHPGQRGLVALLAGLATLATGPSAHAADETVSGRSSQRGVEVEVERFVPGRQVPGQIRSEGNRSSGPSCTLVPWFFAPGTAKGGIPPTPQHRRFLVSCGHQVIGTRWIGPADPLAAAAARAIDIAGIAERVLRQIPLGDIAVGHRPEARALTGIPVYAWVEGYDGRPLARTVRELGVTVDVRITLSRAAWDFGDGTPPVLAGLGEPWPARSSVHHTYGTTTPHGHPRIVAATLSFFTEYRVDGGPWRALAPITRTATAALEVDEVQAVRNR